MYCEGLAGANHAIELADIRNAAGIALRGMDLLIGIPEAMTLGPVGPPTGGIGHPLPQFMLGAEIKVRIVIDRIIEADPVRLR